VIHLLAGRPRPTKQSIERVETKAGRFGNWPRKGTYNRLPVPEQMSCQPSPPGRGGTNSAGNAVPIATRDHRCRATPGTV
jgi:hypothetical protein